MTRNHNAGGDHSPPLQDKDSGVSGFILKILPYLEKISRIKVLNSLRESVLWSIPVVVAGFLVIFFLLEPEGTLSRRGMESFSGALGLMGPWIALYLPFAHSRQQNQTRGIISGVLSLTVFVFLMMPLLNEGPSTVDVLITLSRGGIPVGMVCGLLSSCVDDYVSPRVEYVIFYPLRLLLGSALASGAYLMALKGINLFLLVDQAIEPLLTGADSLPAALMVTGLMSLLWLGGIHGSGVVGGVVLPLYMVAFNANVVAHSAGEPLPYIVTPPFLLLCQIGGTGATLPLCFYMLFSRSRHLRKVASVSLLPSLVNINEPLIFGVPLVMNPTIAIPFILVPLIITAVSYGALYFRIVERFFLFPPFVLPAPLYGYLANLDWRSVILVMVNLVIAFALYRPFFLVLEKIHLDGENKEHRIYQDNEAG